MNKFKKFFINIFVLKKISRLSAFFALSLFIFFNFYHDFALAKEFTVTPFIIDETIEPRRTIEKTVLLKNNSTYRKYVVYATVNEISLGLDGKISEFIPPVESDKSKSVTSWIQVSRGRLEIEPEEELSVPITIKTAPNAEPGDYYAFVGFVPAKNRPQAQEKVFADEADGVIVKISIPDQREAALNIKKFKIDRFVTDPGDREILIELENNGDLEIIPTGEIIFYNSRGEEISNSIINNNKKIKVGETAILTSVIPDSVNSLGKVRADLKIKYKGAQTNFTDSSVYFYIMPFYVLAMIFTIIFLLIGVVVLFLRKLIAKHQKITIEGEDVSLYVRDGHSTARHKHDIDLSGKK